MTLTDYVDITGWKSVGTKIAGNDLKDITLVSDGNESEAPTLFG